MHDIIKAIIPCKYLNNWHLFIYYQVLKENELVIILYTSYSLFISFILNYITFYFK